jgi:hypothetical protein
LAETRANAYADGIVTEAEQNAINEAQTRLDALRIGSQNLISKKMMLKWNEKNKNIAVWGQDEDGIYLDVAPKLLFNNITTEAHNPVFDIKFKANTQYVLSVEWKHKSPNPDNTGLGLYIEYDDGTRSNVFLAKDIKTKTITNVISEAGKTISKIYSGYGNGDINALIYNISLIEGNKPLQGFPVAEEDQTGANNVNLADGTKEVVVGPGSNWAYKILEIPKIKPNTVYYVSFNAENLAGSPSEYSAVLYGKGTVGALSLQYKEYSKNGHVIISTNNFDEQEGELLLYAGKVGATANNKVKFTEVMLVEGFLPAPVWTPSFSEQQAEINITKGLIENKVSLDVYNENDQLIKSDISNLQVSYNQISSTVSKIINGTQEISGVVTQSNFVTIFSSNKNALGQEVIESINVGGGGVTIDASRINLNGAISANGNVQITTDGKLIAVNGEFTGKITATEGRFGNLKISGNKFVAESGNGIEFSSPGSGYTRINTIGTNISIKNDSGVCLALDGRGKGGSNTACLNIINDEYGKAINSTGSAEFILKTGGSILFMSESSRLYNIQILSDRTTFEKPVYFKNLTEAPSSNYYLCIDRKTKQLYYR